jgi:deazaflavin-dependent oxidoreductase (nitroreductase family)
VTATNHQQESFNHRLRRFNKRYFNRFSLGLAGRPGSPWAVIEHRGRVSGRPYTTPIVARPQDDHFVIPLPYGADVDWCQNVLATGEATVISGGQAYKVAEPAIVPIAEAISAFPDWMQEVATEEEDAQFLRLHKVSEAEGAYERLEEMHPI